MIRRNVGFTLLTDGSVSPSLPQYGGVKGEHNVTALEFIMNTVQTYEEGDLVRLSFCTGDGTVLSSDLLDVQVSSETNNTKVCYPLPQTLTMAGGQLCVRLVMSRVDESGCEVEVFRSGEAVVYFDEAAVENGTPFWTGVSQMLKRTVTAKEAAVKAQEAAESAKDEAEAAADANAQAIADNTTAIGVLRAMLNESSRSIVKHEEAIAENKAECDTRLTQTAAALQNIMSSKLDKSGHAPNMYLGTDDKGKVVPKGAPSGGGGADLPFTGIGEGFYVDENNGELTIKREYLEQIIDEHVECQILETYAIYRFKGSVASYTELDTIQNPQIGDVYNILNTGMNAAWTGDNWDALGATVTANDIITGGFNEMGTPVSGYAVAQYVQAQIQAYDADAMALLGEDGDGE